MESNKVRRFLILSMEFPMGKCLCMFMCMLASSATSFQSVSSSSTCKRDSKTFLHDLNSQCPFSIPCSSSPIQVIFFLFCNFCLIIIVYMHQSRWVSCTLICCCCCFTRFIALEGFFFGDNYIRLWFILLLKGLRVFSVFLPHVACYFLCFFFLNFF